MSMYALAQPNPDDMQHRLPLGRPVELDLCFPKSAALTGRVVDEEGKPLTGCKVQIGSADLLDDKGQETQNFAPNVWRSLPGSIGLALTNSDGRFRLDGLPDRASFAVTVQRPESDDTRVFLFAATVDDRHNLRGQPLMGSLRGPQPHEIQTGDLEIMFPSLRRIAVSLVGDDTDKPIPGISVYSLGDNSQTGPASFGTTDAAGRVMLWLPPGKFRAIRADPPVQSRYIRTEEGPLIVEPRHVDQTHHFLLKSGCEFLIEAVEAGTNKPVPQAFFWKVSTEARLQRDRINVSPSLNMESLTNANGALRAVLTPELGKRYRFEFAGIHQPNMPPWSTDPAMAKKYGYLSDPVTSEPVELTGGKTIRLRFELRKEK